MEGNSGLDMWEALPEECKSMILSRLSNREVARLARVSKEFDQAVKNVRDAIQLLVLPPDLSPPALQGFVSSHKNIKSLSFRRCSGKVKKFLPILEAAAGGKLDSKWYHRRSLESVDFRSCTALTDVDVNALCVLHSRLDDVNLANCQSITDVALTVLSRYQQSRPALNESISGDSVTLSMDILEESDEIPVSLCKGLASEQICSDSSWPELRPHAHLETSKSVETGEITPWIPKRKENFPVPATQPELPEIYENVSLDVGEDSRTDKKLPLSKSYAQAASKGLTGGSNSAPPHPYGPNSGNFSVKLDRSRHSSKEAVTLPYIDWTSVVIPSGTSSETVLPGASSTTNRPNSLRSNAAGKRPVMEEDLHQDVLRSQLFWNDKPNLGGKLMLSDVKKAQQSFPNTIKPLNLDLPLKKDFLRKDSSRPATARRSKKVITEVDAKGTDYYSFDLESSGDKRFATRRSLHIPNSPASTSEAEYKRLLEEFKASKAIRVGGAIQVTDQRLDMPGKSAKKRVEAFSTTQTDLGLFTISRERPERTETSDTEDNLPNNLLDTVARGACHSDRSTPLPLGLEGLQVGAMMRHGRHKDIAPDLLEHSTDSPLCSGKGSELESWRARGLSSVCVAGCSEVSDKGVQALLRGPSKDSLVSLDISRCCGVTSAGLRLPHVSALEVLTAAQLPNITRLLLQLSSEGALQHLSLAACPKLDDLHLVAPYLRTLNLSNCKKLTRLQLKCPELLSCNISLCESLENIGRFTCGALQSLNAYGCRLLTPAALAGILESAVGLRELRCGGCDCLERIDLPQPSLLHVEAPGCSSLRRLYVHSRLLKVIDACGCKKLSEVYLYSPNLRRMLFSNCALLQTLVIPLDSIKDSVDTAIKNQSQNPNTLQEGLEISISGCNVSDSVRKNLARLTKQWKATFMA